MVKLRHQIGSEFKALLFTHNLIAGDDDTPLSQTWILKKPSEIESGNYPRYFKYSINQYAQQWEQLNARLKEITRVLKQQSEENMDLQQIYIKKILNKKQTFLRKSLHDLVVLDCVSIIHRNNVLKFGASSL